MDQISVYCKIYIQGTNKSNGSNLCVPQNIYTRNQQIGWIKSLCTAKYIDKEPTNRMDQISVYRKIYIQGTNKSDGSNLCVLQNICTRNQQIYVYCKTKKSLECSLFTNFINLCFIGSYLSQHTFQQSMDS